MSERGDREPDGPDGSGAHGSEPAGDGVNNDVQTSDNVDAVSSDVSDTVDKADGADTAGDTTEDTSEDTANDDGRSASTANAPGGSTAGPGPDSDGDSNDDPDRDSDRDSDMDGDSDVLDAQQPRRRSRRPVTAHEPAPQLSSSEQPPVRERPATMPRTVRFALIALFTLAGLLLLTSALLYFGRDQQATDTIRALEEANQENIPSHAEITRASVIAALIQGGMALLAIVGGWWTRAGKQWARLLSMAVTTFVAVLLLQSLFAGALSIVSMVVLVLAVLTVIFLALRPSAEWCGAPARRR